MILDAYERFVFAAIAFSHSSCSTFSDDNNRHRNIECENEKESSPDMT